ncbi:MAG: divergent polysaccharide deacetylase family protein [Magnetococcales bacterium]|nr:divergent polysaccharide deacetylase family protein [Magnetococcales bacterium]
MGESNPEKRPFFSSRLFYLASFFLIIGLLAGAFWIMEHDPGLRGPANPLPKESVPAAAEPARSGSAAVSEARSPEALISGDPSVATSGGRITAPMDEKPGSTERSFPESGALSSQEKTIIPARDGFTDLHTEPATTTDTASPEHSTPPSAPGPGIMPGDIVPKSFLPDPFINSMLEDSFPEKEPEKGDTTSDPTLRPATRLKPEPEATSASPPRATGEKKDHSSVAPEGGQEILYEEELPTVEPPPEKHDQRSVPLATTWKQSSGPRIALVIDDLGYNRPISKAIVLLPADLTLAVLPGGGSSKEVAEMARASGRELILHQPMQPQGYPGIDPGPGALFSSMSEDRIQEILKENFKLFPNAIGLNNHMGSHLTNDSRVMDAVMRFLKPRGLIFFDSRTSARSVAESRARAMDIPTARRDVFIDNVQDKQAILKRLEELVTIAKSHGRSIGIGHPHQATLDALRDWLPSLRGKGIELARLSHFLTQPSLTKETKPVPVLEERKATVRPGSVDPVEKIDGDGLEEEQPASGRAPRVGSVSE